MKNQRDKETLLIVDDEPGNRKILMEILGREYKIIAASNGRQAIERIEKGHMPDLILLDIMMPEMDGYEVCRRLKQNALTLNIPIIFITALDEGKDETKGFEVGAVDYITKPFYPPVVLARVNTHIALKRKNDLLEKLACLDGLTEIYNRRRFDETFKMEWKRAKRNKTDLSLILLDVDFFKRYNDHYGHSRGDTCLTRVAQAIDHHKGRPGDLAARYGGEEFVVLLPETDGTGAFTIAETIRRAVMELNIPHEHSEAADTVTISLGTATMTSQDDWQLLDFLDSVDHALYQAKKSGRNRVVSFEKN